MTRNERLVWVFPVKQMEVSECGEQEDFVLESSTVKGRGRVRQTVDE